MIEYRVETGIIVCINKNIKDVDEYHNKTDNMTFDEVVHAMDRGHRVAYEFYCPSNYYKSEDVIMLRWDGSSKEPRQARICPNDRDNVKRRIVHEFYSYTDERNIIWEVNRYGQHSKDLIKSVDRASKLMPDDQKEEMVLKHGRPASYVLNLCASLVLMLPHFDFLLAFIVYSVLALIFHLSFSCLLPSSGYERPALVHQLGSQK